MIRKFIKKCFFTAMTFLSYNVLNVNSLECVSMNNQECNDKMVQRWNDYKCRCECKELIDKGTCNKGFIWNPSNCECECDKSCDIGEYLDYKNCRCRKKN